MIKGYFILSILKYNIVSELPSHLISPKTNQKIIDDNEDNLRIKSP
jgi:hypothetical protein